MSSKNAYVGVPVSTSKNVTVFGGSVFLEVMKLLVGSQSNMTVTLIKGGNWDTDYIQREDPVETQREASEANPVNTLIPYF